MKKILYGSMTGLALFLVAGCTSKTPTAVSSTNEQKETVISTTEQVHPYNKKQRRHQRRQVR